MGKPQFYYIEVRCKGYKTHGHVILMNPAFYPLVTDGLSHPYHLEESIGHQELFFIFISFFDESRSSKRNTRLRWDAAFCGVTSGAILFAYVP